MRTALLLLISAFFIPCAQAQIEMDSLPAPPDPPTPPVLSEEVMAVKKVVDRFGQMWEDENMNTFSRIIAHDPNMVVIGTDTAEYIVGYEQFRQIRQEQFEAFDNIEFYVEDQRIRLSESSDVAWFSEKFTLFTTTEDTSIFLDGLRLSGVLERRDGAWRIVQLHTSVPVAGQAVEY